MISGSLVIAYQRHDGTRVYYVVDMNLPENFAYSDILERARSVDMVTELRLLDPDAETVWKIEHITLENMAEVV